MGTFAGSLGSNTSTEKTSHRQCLEPKINILSSIFTLEVGLDLVLLFWKHEFLSSPTPCVCAKLLQLDPAFCDTMDYCSPPGSSVHGILHARILGQAVCHFLLQGIFPTQGSNLCPLGLLCCKQVLYHWATTEAQEYWSGWPFPSPGGLLDTGIESRPPTWQADSLPSEPPGNKDTVLPYGLWTWPSESHWPKNVNRQDESRSFKWACVIWLLLGSCDLPWEEHVLSNSPSGRMRKHTEEIWAHSSLKPSPGDQQPEADLWAK